MYINIYSGSLLVSTQFKVQLNEASRLSLKKTSNVNLRAKFSLDGSRNTETFTYNLNLQPKPEVTLFSYE